VLSKFENKSSGVDFPTVDGGNVVSLEPSTERLEGFEMGVVEGIISDDETSNVDIFRFELFEESVTISGSLGNTVLTENGGRANEDLISI